MKHENNPLHYQIQRGIPFYPACAAATLCVFCIIFILITR